MMSTARAARGSMAAIAGMLFAAGMLGTAGCADKSLDTSGSTSTTRGSRVFATSNGGDIWTAEDLVYRTLNSVTNTRNGSWVAVRLKGVILRSEDGGTNWSLIPSGTEIDLFGVSNNLVTGSALAVGSDGRLLRSTDDGLIWTTIASGTTNDLRGIASYANIAIAVGEQGTILRSSNGGASWTARTAVANSSLYDVAFTSPDTIYAVGSLGVVLRSSDAGGSWSELATPEIPSNASLTSLASPAPGVVVITSYHYDANDHLFGRLIRTLDAGASWKVDSTGVNENGHSFPLEALYSVGTADGMVMAVGTGVTTLVSADNGSTWSAWMGLGGTARMYDIAMYARGHALAVGDH